MSVTSGADEQRGSPPSVNTNRMDGTVLGGLVQAAVIQRLEFHYPQRARPIPRELPPPMGAFVNRVAETRAISAALDAPRHGVVPAVVVLSGAHGVGKSATSIQWAHQHADAFVDGQIHVTFADVRDRAGLTLEETLGRVLLSLGVEPDRMPASTAERMSLYRSLSAGRRLLLVIDDPTDAAQVVPLIPSSAHALVLVATTARLTELELDGAHPVPIEPLDEPELHTLLTSYLGQDRVDDEPMAVRDLLRLCGGLPLAARVCAMELRARPHLTVAELVARIEARSADQHDGEHALSAIDAVFESAYRALPSRLRDAYRLLALHPTPRMAVDAAAAVLDQPIGHTVRVLDDLAGRHLLDRIGNGYQFPYLAWRHGRSLWRSEGAAGERREVTSRIARHYAELASRLDHALIHRRLRLTPVAWPADALPTRAAAFELFARERLAIGAAQHQALAEGHLEPAWRIGEALWPVLDAIHDTHTAIEVYGCGADAAAYGGYRDAEARLRAQLAHALMDDAQLDAADDQLARADLLANHAPELLRSSILEMRGKLRVRQGDVAGALHLFDDARLLAARAGSVKGVAIQDYLAGSARLTDHDPAGALPLLRAAAAAVDRDGDAILSSRVLLRLGDASLATSDALAAVRCWGEVIDIARAHTLPGLEAEALERIARVEHARGASTAARVIRDRVRELELVASRPL
ncbi:NB-ARC domain-containing protein [Galbitalea sp. SE-J8]|uniref:NB-ARC domain-containing protein n=1 Tax=Galbitalea sp. SE-J8 TaxID=3054952 RepID=UPI00259CDB9A|nr:NB-ARC domain-containing protein [Galbitalea sp. SE-J8]MDM4764331.1 NB-ARC domain-containing protein [Galbitalea sp. SE-J8]